MNFKKIKEIAGSMMGDSKKEDEKPGEQMPPGEKAKKNPHNAEALGGLLEEQKNKRKEMMDDLFPGSSKKK